MPLQNVTRVTLGEVGEFSNGVNFGKEAMGTGWGVINVKDIFQSGVKLDFSHLDRVDVAGNGKISHYTVAKYDIFFVRSSVKRDGIGLVSYSPSTECEVVHCGFIIRFRVRDDRANPIFVAYALRSPHYRETLKGLSGGTAIINISQAVLRALPLELPARHIQQWIADILSTYDNLIENNNRRIKILEQKAQMLYREWFINFHFPGYEKVRMVKSNRGNIPEGWACLPCTEAVEIDPSTRVPREGLKPFVPMGSLSPTSMLISDIEEREGNAGSKFRNGDTLFARITPCLENGKTGFVQFLPTADAIAFGSTEFIVLRSQTVCPEYVYLMAKSDEFRSNAIKSMSGATGRQRVQQRCFEKFSIAQPPATLLRDFQAVVSPMFQLIHILSLKNANLRKTRDLLLPKLVSGEVGVEQLENEAIAQNA